MVNDIFEFITTEENIYNTQPIPVVEGWEWNMREHINTSTLYKNSQLVSGKNKGTINEKPVKNIVRPILNLRYRAEDIEMKDITLYVDDPDKYYLSFLIKKYHDDVFVVENDLDTFFDKVKESKIDYGGGLIKDVGEAKPEFVPLQSIAFCDQTDILSGPIGLKHYYSPDQLKEMEDKGWGDTKNGATISIDDLILLAQDEKITDDKQQREVDTPGKYIELYEVHGSFPENFYDEDGKETEYFRQMHIVGFYTNPEGVKVGVTLFKSKEKESPFKFVTSEEIYSRALGWGGVEELFEPQIWTNYDMIRMKDMLDAASKTVLKTNDPSVAAKHPNGLKGVDNLEIIELGENGDLGQLDTFPRNISLFERSVNQWEEHAQRMGAATDPLLGESPAAGTPFRLQERVVLEGKGLHEYRRGKYAKWIEEVYKDWIIPYIAKEVTKGTKFLSELSPDEMEKVADSLVEKRLNDIKIKAIMNGQVFDPLLEDGFREQIKEDFMKGGNERFIEILKDELKDAPLKVKVNVIGKQKDLAGMTDKLTNILRDVMGTYNPQTGTFAILEDPTMSKLFNQIIEASGLSPITWGGKKRQEAPQQALNAPQQAQQSPVPANVWPKTITQF